MRSLPFALLPAALWSGLAVGRTLEAGPGLAYPSPSAAARDAVDGDTIQIAPGEYYDCIVSDRRLTIQGPATLTDKTCEGKALLVLRGNGTVVRDLVLARARVPDANGAGIRLEGRDATIERVVFENNEVGVLGGAGRVTLRDCTITAGHAGMTAILVGEADMLVVQNTRVRITHGLALSSSAGVTTITGGAIETSDQGLLLSGPATIDGVAVALSGEATSFARATGGNVTIRRTTLVNTTGRGVALLLDWGPGAVVLDGNTVGPGDREVATSGAWRYRAGLAARSAKAGMRDVARAVKHAVMGP